MRKLTPILTMPLGFNALVGEDLTIRTPKCRAIVSVQVERLASTAMETATLRGVRFPRNPNTTSGRDPLIWWIGPERWLVSSEELHPLELVGELTAITEGRLAAIVDVSDSLRIIELLGTAARHLLARGTSLGLDEPVLLGPGRCARTRFTDLAVFVRPLEETGYELLVDRSEAQFLLEWLRDSSVALELKQLSKKDDAPVAGSVAANCST